MNMTNIIWPEIFITGKLPKDSNEQSLCADALEGWGCCMSGMSKIPDNFGYGMAVIGEKLGISSLPDSIESFAIEKGYLKSKS